MTKEEAIKELETLKYSFMGDFPPTEALNMAIEALEREQRNMSKVKGATEMDKQLHALFENVRHFKFRQPYGDRGRYLTYYAEDRLYLVFDRWYHGFFLVEASSPIEAIEAVNCDRLEYLPKGDE